MKKKLIGVFLFMSLICGSVSAQGLPDRKETLKTLVKVNDYFMKKYADYRTPSYNGIIRPSNIWTRGVYYEGLMALHSIFPREDYYNYVMPMTSVADRFISICIICLPTRRRSEKSKPVLT